MESHSLDSFRLPWADRIRSAAKNEGVGKGKFPGTIHFFTPTLFFKDAVSRCVLEEAEMARLICQRVEVYAENRIGEVSKAARHWSEFFDRVDPEKDVLVYHYSIGTDSLKQIVNHPVKKHVVYHGITPPALVEAFSPETAALCKKGIEEFSLLNGFKSWATNSEFLMRELESAETGSHEKWILPPFLVLDKWDDIRSESILPSLPPQAKQLLYVGRRNPSKNIEALVQILADIRKLGDYRLIIAGTGATPSYHLEIQNLINSCGLQDCVRFIDEPSDQGLKYLYESSAALVTTSLHEGFCVPLAEAMKLGVPAFAFPNSALQQTLGSTSPALIPGNAAESAQIIHANLEDENSREKLVKIQHQQYLTRFSDPIAIGSYYRFFKSILTHG